MTPKEIVARSFFATDRQQAAGWEGYTDDAQAALQALEEAGYRVVPKEMIAEYESRIESLEDGMQYEMSPNER